MTTATRFSGLPDVPTVAEAGIAGYDAAAWYGVLAPAKTPPDIVAQLNREVAAVAHMPEVKQRLEPLAAATVGNTSEEFAAFVRAEYIRWSRLIRDSGVQVTQN